jgi:hypothetical protein
MTISEFKKHIKQKHILDRTIINNGDWCFVVPENEYPDSIVPINNKNITNLLDIGYDMARQEAAEDAAGEGL